MQVFFSDKVLRIGSFGIDFRHTAMWTYNEHSDKLSYSNIKHTWQKWKYDSYGNKIAFCDSAGFWSKRTYDSNGTCLTYSDNTGYFWGLYESTN